MKTSVIITTYNRADRLGRCVLACLNQHSLEDEYEVILVDDHSTDGTSEVCVEFARTHSRLTYLRNAKNLGSAGSRNHGISMAQGDLLLFIDDDIVPSSSYVGEHQRLHDLAEDEHIAVVGNLSYTEDTFTRSNFGRYMQSRYLGYRSRKDLGRIDFHDLPARCFGAGISSARRTDIESIGRFDANIQRYGGEDEYAGFLLKEKGVRLVFGERCHAVHEDAISLPRHKIKILELSSSGYRYLMERAPEYFEQTQIRLLLPEYRQKISIRRRIVNRALGLVLNPVTTKALEWWLIKTDGMRSLYCQPLYRALMAGWTIQGLRQQTAPSKATRASLGEPFPVEAEPGSTLDS